MSYFYARRVDGEFAAVADRVREALKANGFGVLTEIDVQGTLKAKIGPDFRPYLILGACNPRMAHEALQMEPNVGVFLPCNVIVQQADGAVEVAAVDPVASMQAIPNPELAHHAGSVGEALRRAVDAV